MFYGVNSGSLFNPAFILCIILNITFLSMGACKSRDKPKSSDSTVKITNPLIVKNPQSLPYVVKIRPGYAEKGHCTATFVGKKPPTLLTARHCVAKDNSMNPATAIPHIFFKDSNDIEYKSQKVFFNPDGNFMKVNPLDLAVVIMPEDLKIEHAAMLSKKPAQLKETVILAGFGNQSADPKKPSKSGELGYGSNTINSIQSGLIIFDGKAFSAEYSGIDSSAGPGDSGGPLFRVENENIWNLIGTCSGSGGEDGKEISDGIVTQVSYVDLFSKNSQELLALAKAGGADIQGFSEQKAANQNLALFVQYLDEKSFYDQNKLSEENLEKIKEIIIQSLKLNRKSSEIRLELKKDAKDLFYYAILDSNKKLLKTISIGKTSGFIRVIE